MLLVAIGCGRLPQMLEIAAKRSFVVLGAMETELFADLASGREPPPDLPVYFYETG